MPPFSRPQMRYLGLTLMFVSTLFGAPAKGGAAALPVIVTTNTILADITRNVVGDAADIRCLVPAGVDMHGFEPKPSDVAALSGAALVIANGAGLEPWLRKLLEASDYSGPLLEATAGIQLLHREAPPLHFAPSDDAHGHGSENVEDPHAWQDPSLGIQYTLNIRNVAVQILPAEERETIEQRSRLYAAELETLAAWMRRLFTDLPADRRSLVTSHDAFAYLGKACRLHIIALRGLDSRQEPDARQVAEFIDFLRAHPATALFSESISNPKVLEQIARDSGARLGGELFSGSLAPTGTAGDSYLGMLRENALRMRSALEQP